MILAYRQQFEEPLLNGTKIHSIREDKPNRWRAGMTIHQAVGVRTKNYKLLREDVCVSTQEIEIIFPHNYVFNAKVKVDGRELSDKEVTQLALNDGFEHIVGFLMWFKDDFKGKIIHWTDLKY